MQIAKCKLQIKGRQTFATSWQLVEQLGDSSNFQFAICNWQFAMASVAYSFNIAACDVRIRAGGRSASACHREGEPGRQIARFGSREHSQTADGLFEGRY